jgi:hypothetical protein
MAIMRKRMVVTGGKLRFSTLTPDGQPTVTGRLECESPITLLFRHVDLVQDGSIAMLAELGLLHIDRAKDSSVEVGLSALRMPPDWPSPEDPWNLCATLLQGGGGRGYPYEFGAHLEVERYGRPIQVEFNDSQLPDSFFKAVNFELHPVTLVQRPTTSSPARSFPFDSAKDFEDKLGLCGPFRKQGLTQHG